MKETNGNVFKVIGLAIGATTAIVYGVIYKRTCDRALANQEKANAQLLGMMTDDE